MHTAREILRLMLLYNMKDRQIARSCRISHVTVGHYRQQVILSKLSFEQLEQMNDDELAIVLKSKRGRKQQDNRPQPDLSLIHQELKKKGVTLQLLWEEYKEKHPDGYERSQFNELYRRYRGNLDLSMRQTHKGGEKLFVDYSGMTVAITDPRTGKPREAQIFTAVMGASNYTYAEATLDQSLPSWIRSHVNAFLYFGGVPAMVVPDNLKSGVNSPCRYDPEINRAYHEMSVHYDTAIVPTRVKKPKDKAKVESGVLVVQRWILAALRNREFFSLPELNTEISRLLEKLNHRRFNKLKGTRCSVFEEVDRPQLKPLPRENYIYAEWTKTRVTKDYHVMIDDHYYSVPYALVEQMVDIRVTDQTVEVFSGNRRFASHLRSRIPRDKTTVKEHMPKSHQLYLETTPSVILAWAQNTGEATHQVIERIMETSRHTEQGYKSCLGIMRLGQRYPQTRMEAACLRALTIGGCSYRSIRSILEKGLDQQPVLEETDTPAILHPNIRGKSYYDFTDDPSSTGEYLC